jgi:hypothetical protein
MTKPVTTNEEKFKKLAEAVRFLFMVMEPIVHPLQVPAVKSSIQQMEDILDA